MSAHGVTVIGGEDMTTGFALAGLPTQTVGPSDDGADMLTQALGRADLAVILADERVMDALSPQVRRRIARSPLPVVVPVPRPRAAAPGKDIGAYLLDILQRAIGYRMRLR